MYEAILNESMGAVGIRRLFPVKRQLTFSKPRRITPSLSQSCVFFEEV